VSVHEGDVVRAGEPLMDGAVDPTTYCASGAKRTLPGTW
jgi:hypothetical protein